MSSVHPLLFIATSAIFCSSNFYFSSEHDLDSLLICLLLLLGLLIVHSSPNSQSDLLEMQIRSLHLAACSSSMLSCFTCTKTHTSLSALPSSPWSGPSDFAFLYLLDNLSWTDHFLGSLDMSISSFPKAFKLANHFTWASPPLIFTQLADSLFLHLFGKASLTIQSKLATWTCSINHPNSPEFVYLYTLFVFTYSLSVFTCQKAM